MLGVSPRVDQLYRHAIEDFARLMRTLDIQPSSAMTGIDGDMLSIGLIGAMVGIGSRWMLSGFTQSLDEMVATSEILFAGVSQQLQKRESLTNPH